MIPTEIGVRLRYLAYKPLFKKTNGFFRIDSGVTIVGFKYISLGANVTFKKNSYVYAHRGGGITLGNNFGINTNSQLGAFEGKITIGDNCSIGPNCVLMAVNHNYKNPDVPFMLQGDTCGEIILEDDIWIASNCVITTNTRIGRSSVIAAGSVVTKDVEPFSLVGGVPAKLIRKK